MPEVKDGIVRIPFPPDGMVVVTGEPFLRYVTMNEVLGVRPINEIEPVAVLQVVGLMLVLSVIKGFGFTVTNTVFIADIQIPKVAVTL